MEVPLWDLRSVQGWALGNSDSRVSRSAKPSRREDRELVDLADSEDLVPKKGLEPPHPCGYMDLNHARLPIPPLRLGNVLPQMKARLVEKLANRGSRAA